MIPSRVAPFSSYPQDEDLNHTNGDSTPITVTIVDAEGLRRADSNGSDPYCVCQVPGKKMLKFKTPTLKNTENPEWNTAQHMLDFAPGDKLQFLVWDSDVGMDDALGNATLEHSQIFLVLLVL